MNRSKSITIIEVGPRDGFQNLADEIPTADKIRIVDLLADTGLKMIETSSFVHPKWIPQLKDAAEVFAGIHKKPGVSYSALIPNEKGLDRAIECGVGEVVFVVAASNSLNRANQNMTTEESLAYLEPIAQKSRRHGIRVRGIIAASFGCSYEGEVPIKQVIDIGKELRRMGAFEISLADSFGMAHPRQVRQVVSRFLREINDVSVGVHFHDTKGTGTANAYAAFEAGVNVFESSIAGLGGCPYALGAPGNVATESLVYMFHKMGIDSGIDLDKLLACAETVKEIVGWPPKTWSSERTRWNWKEASVPA
ncbi:MAG TPA: hydroxymethylglutaryl-CoA lyase [Dehalococcoidia bacterium]|nr:hydroxymethylglutaryl-CoA lyase [Dehalococcoidia bacterium]